MAVDKACPVSELQAEDSFIDKYSREHPIYFNFDIRTYQRPPPGLSTKNKFINMKAENIYARHFPTLFSGKNLWMIKPSGLSRGRGIELFTTLEELKKLLHYFTKDGVMSQDYSIIGYRDDQKHSPFVKFEDEGQASKELSWRKPSHKAGGTTVHSFVIQKYIEKPLLYKGFKFDIRVFALFTHKKELFVFR